MRASAALLFLSSFHSDHNEISFKFSFSIVILEVVDYLMSKQEAGPA